MKDRRLVTIPIIVLAVAVVASVLWNVYRPQQPPDQTMAPTDPTAVTTQTPPANTNTAPSMCYYTSTKASSGFYDKAWISMNVQGNNITGEYHSFPAEKDASGGTFTGTIDTQDQNSTSNLANVVVHSQAEGMDNKDQLFIVYDNTKASVGFGEMVQSPTDATTYVYKDLTKITYGNPIPAIDCGTLSEINAAETYVKSNIGTIIGTNETLTANATWSVTSVAVDQTAHTIDVSFTDGHVSKKATLEYTYDPTAGVAITKFTEVK